jgi:hypothetical protein
MLSHSYTDYIFQVKGENIVQHPKVFFEPNGVYLLVDKDLNIIWIWAGVQSRLFHRYMASNWAGKLKRKQKFFQYRYEVIKQGKEPDEFITIFNEIEEGRMDLSYPGESRKLIIKSKELNLGKIKKAERKISNSEKAQIRKILTEITEMQMHIKYSMEHIGKRIAQIEKILNR